MGPPRQAPRPAVCWMHAPSDPHLEMRRVKCRYRAVGGMTLCIVYSANGSTRHLCQFRRPKPSAPPLLPICARCYLIPDLYPRHSGTHSRRPQSPRNLCAHRPCFTIAIFVILGDGKREHPTPTPPLCLDLTSAPAEHRTQNTTFATSSQDLQVRSPLLHPRCTSCSPASYPTTRPAELARGQRARPASLMLTLTLSARVPQPRDISSARRGPSPPT